MARPGKKNSYNYGLRAEYMCLWFLRFRGYHILAQRYKTPVGEIDLIARKKDVLVFVEVKARQTVTEASESLSAKMRNRITRAAEFYISQNPQMAGLAMRFDLLACAPPFHIRHLDNAWLSTT